MALNLVVGTFGSENVYALPCDAVPDVLAPSSVKWIYDDKVAESGEEFGYQSQVFDWMQSMWLAEVSLPVLDRYSHDFWSAFFARVRHGVGVFLLGDPRAALPKGVASGSPVVLGASQTGYSVVTAGWTPGVTSILLPGDYLQIGYRLYKVLTDVSSDANGQATIPVWPNLRDLPADQTPIITRNCRGLFRLQAGDKISSSVNVSGYGVDAFTVREAV